MLDSCTTLLTLVTAQIENIEKETERVAMLTKRMMELPLPEPPMMTEPTLMESERASSKRRRRTRYTPLPISWKLQKTWSQARGSLRDAPDLTWTLLLVGECVDHEELWLALFDEVR